jgi:hypothetical protein
MGLAMIVLSFFANMPGSQESPPERTLHAIAAYVRMLALKKGMDPSAVARVLGIEQCPATQWSHSPTGSWFVRQYPLCGGRDLMLVYAVNETGRNPGLTHWYMPVAGNWLGFFD